MKRLTYIILALSFVACTGNETKPIKNKESIVLSTTRTEKSVEEPNGGGLDFVYQRLTESPASPIHLNSETWKTFSDSILFIYNFSGNLDSIANDLINEYDAVVSDLEDYNTPWFLEVVESEHYNTPEWLGLTIYTNSYMGGAHPNENFFFIHINPQSSTFYTIDSITNQKSELKARVLNKLREKNRSIDSIPHINNFSLSADSIMFFYNTFEITDFSEGAQSATFSRSELADLITLK